MSIEQRLEHDEHAAEHPREHGGAHPVDSDGKPTTPADKKKADNRQKALIALTFAGVVVTYLIYRSSKSGGSTSTLGGSSGYPANAAAGYDPSATSAGIDPYATAGFESYLGNINHQVKSQNGALRRLEHEISVLERQGNGTHPRHHPVTHPHPHHGHNPRKGGGSRQPEPHYPWTSRHDPHKGVRQPEQHQAPGDRRIVRRLFNQRHQAGNPRHEKAVHGGNHGNPPRKRKR